MKKYACLLALLLAPAMASAAPLTIKAKDGWGLVSALTYLSNGLAKPAKVHDERHGQLVDKVIYEPFEIAEGGQAAIAKNLFRLHAVLDPKVAELTDLRKRLCPEAEPAKCTDASKKEIEDAAKALDESEITFDAVALNQADLHLGKNRIQSANLVPLAPVAEWVK